MNAKRPPCWPDDPDYLDGRKELRLPKGKLQAHWDVDILDTEGVPPNDIIEASDPFDVRFRVELVGDLWRCLCGDWCFDIGFDAVGEGLDFDLSKRLPAPGLLDVKDWKGCDRTCIEKTYRVAAGTIPDELCGTVYEVVGKFAFRCCEGDKPVLVGYEKKRYIEFYG
jgi:hypothetical protein